jgi:adenylate cyclase
LGKQLLHLAQSAQDPALLLEAHLALGYTLFHLGELVSARAHLEQTIALYDPEQHRSHAVLYGRDPGVWSRQYAALARWLLGFPDQALKGSRDALTLAHESARLYSLAFALTLAAVLHQYRREEHAACEQAEATMTLSTEQGFPFWLAMGTIVHGWALAEQGQAEEGIAQMQQSMTAFRAIGTELARPHFLALLTEGYKEMGRVEEGLSALAEALAVVDKTGERWYEVELYRLKGELTLQQWKVESQKSKVPNPQPLAPSTQVEGEAEKCFLKAIEIAQKQQAKSLELRATVSLARLWQSQGKRHAARDMLSVIYNWFTEGVDTADLKEAKALLEDLDR